MAEEDSIAPSSGNRKLKVTRILGDTLYAAVTSADASNNAVGTLLTLDATATKVTATATKGWATIVSKELGTGASGTTLIVKFKEVS